MGGIGSGRHWHYSVKDTTGSFCALDIRRLAREGLLRRGNAFEWQWERVGRMTSSIKVAIEDNRVRLKYRFRSNGGDWQDMEYPVQIERTPCHFGGARVWFRCPAQGCGRRVAKLYGGAVFACRHCHDLAYPSQREHASDRAARRCKRLRKQLGWGGSIFDPPGPRPKGMHKTTFARLSHEANQAATESFALALNRFGPDPLLLEYMRGLGLDAVYQKA